MRKAQEIFEPNQYPPSFYNGSEKMLEKILRAKETPTYGTVSKPGDTIKYLYSRGKVTEKFIKSVYKDKDSACR